MRPRAGSRKTTWRSTFCRIDFFRSRAHARSCARFSPPLTQPMSQVRLIEARGVAKTYQSKDGPVESLKPLDFAIQEGEFVSVVGPSGCGKSTLLKMVAGLLPISSGELTRAGKPIEGPQKDVGIVFQSAVLLPWRSVEDNILLQAEMRHLPKAASQARARELMEMAGLQGFEGKYPWQLSGGMQQRASICRALLHDPSVLLLDEPFRALDAITPEKRNLNLHPTSM